MDILNNIHNGSAPDWMNQIPDAFIHCTITSPPVYDDELYILEGGEAEFGWKSYEEYTEHLYEVFNLLYRKTVNGGMLIIDTSSGPKETGDKWEELFPIPADIIMISQSIGWKFRNEVIWERKHPLYQKHDLEYSPNLSIRQKHHQLLFFQKNRNRNPCGNSVEFTSVWRFEKESKPSVVKPYNEVYQVFPDELLERLITHWSCKNDIIFDPYAGSGQVLRVAKRMNRQFIGLEADSKWARLWEDITS